MAKEPYLDWGFGESLSEKAAFILGPQDEYEWRGGKRRGREEQAIKKHVC